MPKKLGFRLGIYVFKDAEIVDFAAPHGVFSVARRFDPELDAFLVADAADGTNTTWTSGQWSVVGFTSSYGKYLYRIRNRWQTGQEMDIENQLGYAQHRALCDPCVSSYWDLVPAP
jgi:hypothetical protein